ncbi:MAG: CRISPR-associated protein Cas4 [Thermoplasmataceae archaeon]
MISFYDYSEGITGSHFYHYGSCRTRLWLFHRHIEVGKDNDHIRIGKHIDETTHLRNRKSLTIQGLCQIDYIENGEHVEVHEIKKGNGISEAIELQVMFYMLVMRDITGEIPRGYVHFPEVKKVIRLELDAGRVEQAIGEIRRIVEGECPTPKRIPICRGCAYEEMCWA